MIRSMRHGPKPPLGGKAVIKGKGRQCAALCYRASAKGGVKVLLITSRGIARWVLPKGWHEPLVPAHEAAAAEAWEEAGVRGRISTKCLGKYGYDKWRPDAPPIPCRVAVYPMAVTRLEQDYPEKGQRRRKWVSPSKAAKLVIEPELAQMLQGFRPRKPSCGKQST